jgi:uncharacterized protein (TIGR04442 family)
MINDLRLHGRIGTVDFFAFAAGAGTYNTYFYEEEPTRIRFFSRGNELTLTQDGVSYKGTGGSFCEYMFGVEKPLKDIEKQDIMNRLVMFGAFLDKNEHVVFTNNTDGFDPFPRLFMQGHAVANYYFLVSSEFAGDTKRRQKHILKFLGKFLKRTSLLADEKDTELLDSFCSELNERKSVVFIFKLINRANREYYEAFRNFYSNKRGLGSQDELFLEDIVVRNGIDRYQQARMKFDIMYKHPENKLVVDEYRDVLIKGISNGAFHASDHARMNRLRTLSIRNNIPTILFDTLDELLLKGKKIQDTKESDYLKEARSILENLFFKDPFLKQHIIQEDIVRLIKAKHQAYSQNDRGFDQVLLDIGRTCDELSRETDDFRVFEEFSSIVTYFDRYDNVQSLLSRMAFMKNVGFREDSLRSIIGNKKAFDALEEGLFESLFIEGLLGSSYITNYGKRKITLLLRGIKNIEQGDASLKDVMRELRDVTNEEKIYHAIHAALKEKMRGFFPGLEMKKIRKKIRDDITAELSGKGIAKKISHQLFERVFLDLQKESVYLNQILPVIIRTMDTSLREDFLENSGLDRFYIESLEKEFFLEKGLDGMVLETIREGKMLTGTGGGERI